MIYCLLGDSLILKKMFIKSVRPNYKTVFPEDNDKLSKIRDFIGSNNMFSQSNAIYVRQLAKWKKEEVQKFIKFLESFKLPENTDLFVDGNLKIKGCKKRSFELPPPWKKELWLNHITKLSKGLNIEITERASEKMFESVGTSEELIYSELKKLGILERTITESDIEKYSYVFQEKNYTEFAYSLLRGKVNSLSFELIRERSTFPIIIAVLTRIVTTTGRIKAELNIEEKYNWNTIKNIAKKLQCKTSTIANIIGFRFSRDDEEQPDLQKKYSLNDLQNLLLHLQTLDEAFKEGRFNEFISYMKLIEYFS